MKTSWLSDNIKSILSLVVTILGISYFYMCSIRDIKPDPQILIAIVGSLGTVLGYFFGSSSGSSKKDEVLTQATNKPVVTNADTVNVDTNTTTTKS